MTYAEDVAAARAAVAVAQQSVDAAQTQLNAAEAALAAATEAYEDAAVALAEAQAALQDLLDNPPPPTPTGKSVVGATVGSNDGGLNLQADVRRCYDLSGSGAKEAAQRAKVGGLVWANYKGTISESALRSELQALVNILKAKNQTGMVTYEHEPDIKDTIPPATYHKGYDQLEKVIKEFPTLEPIVCMTGFSGDKNPSIWETYWRPLHKKIGFDHYNKGHQGQGEPLSTPAQNWGPLLAWAKTKGKPVCIGETGVGDDAVAGPVIKTQAQWYAEHRKFVLDPANNIAVACAFDSGLALLNQAEAKAWFGV